jgi:hypothetical protein
MPTMSESPSTQGQAASLAARFDAARDTFLAAFAQAPDEALPYTPAGEDYALGVLPIHLQDSMNHYLDVYQRVTAANYGPVDLGADPANAAMLADLDATHRRVTERFRTLDDETVTRQAAVVYAPGSEPYPTSVADIFGWLTDHYDEHVAQTAQLLARWQSERAQ